MSIVPYNLDDFVAVCTHTIKISLEFQDENINFLKTRDELAPSTVNMFADLLASMGFA